MPIYEYKCRGCGHEFEALLMPKSKETPKCPSCQSEELEQLLSAFGVNSAEHSSQVWRAAQTKFEKTELREKKVAERESINHHLNNH